MSLKEESIQYKGYGLCVLPTKADKRPSSDIGSWTKYQETTPTDEELEKWFAIASHVGLGIVTGAISGNLEVLDFDDGGSQFESWKQKLPKEFFKKLTIERTPSGGYHVFYRCDKIDGAQKLAMKPGNVKGTLVTLIETRGEGGFIKCSPSEGYKLIQGDFEHIPNVTSEERLSMLMASRQLDQRDKTDEATAKPASHTSQTVPSASPVSPGKLRPGDDYNGRGDEHFRGVLKEQGWKYQHTARDGNERWERPGKDEHSTSATLKFTDGKWCFYNFSSSVDKFEPNENCSIFEAYTRMQHDGDYTSATKALAGLGYGSDKSPVEQNEIDLEALARNAESFDTEESRKAIERVKSYVYSDDEDKDSNKRSDDSFIEFPLEMLPREIREYIEIKALMLNQRPSALALVMLSFLGGLIGGASRVEPVPGWKVYPTIWSCFIGISGLGKSPVIKATTDLIKDKQEEFRKEYVSRCAEWAFEQKQYEKAKKKGENVLPPIKPGWRKIFVQDSTFEGLVKDIEASHARTILCLDELSYLFAMMNRKGTPGEASRWLSLHDGGMYQSSRSASQEVFCRNALATIYGGSTPEKFKEFILSNGGDKDGTLSRFFLVWSPFRQECHTPTDEEIDSCNRKTATMQRIVDAIIDFEPRGECQVLSMSPDVLPEWYDWCKMVHEGIQASRNDNESSLFSKGKTLPANIAVILHFIKSALKRMEEEDWGYLPSDEDKLFTGDTTASQSDYGDVRDCMEVSDEIDYETWKAAKEISDWVIDENWKVHRMLQFVTAGIDKEQIKRIFEVIKGTGDKGASLRDIGRKICGYRSEKGKKELVKVLDLFIKGHMISKIGVTSGNNKITEKYFYIDTEKK